MSLANLSPTPHHTVDPLTKNWHDAHFGKRSGFWIGRPSLDQKTHSNQKTRGRAMREMELSLNVRAQSFF